MQGQISDSDEVAQGFCGCLASLQGFWSSRLHSKLFSSGMSLLSRLKATAQPGSLLSILEFLFTKLGGRGRLGSMSCRWCITPLLFRLSFSPRKLETLLCMSGLGGKAMVSLSSGGTCACSLAAVTVRCWTNYWKSWLSSRLFLRLKVIFLRRWVILSMGRIFRLLSNFSIPSVLAWTAVDSLSQVVSSRLDRQRLLFLPLLRKWSSFSIVAYSSSTPYYRQCLLTAVQGRGRVFLSCCMCQSCRIEERQAIELRFTFGFAIGCSNGAEREGRVRWWSYSPAGGGASFKSMMRTRLPVAPFTYIYYLQLLVKKHRTQQYSLSLLTHHRNILLFNFLSHLIIFIFVIFMHKPLSLFPRSSSSSSSATKNADSLAFSLSDKQHSQASMLVEEQPHSVSKQLQSLQMKLSDLETQIMPITMETAHDRTIKYAPKFDHHSTAEFFKKKKMRSEGKENTMQRANSSSLAGKIVSRQKGKLGKTLSRKVAPLATPSTTYHTRNSIATESSILVEKSKQVIRLKKQMQAVRHSLEKTQRSMSECSERLSASKSIIKRMKLQQKRYQKDCQRLRGQLKKSQGIRQKQKQVILTQRRELQRCRQLLRRVGRV